MAVAGDIVARLTADTAPFTRELNGATGTLNRFGSMATKMFAGLAAGFTLDAVISKTTEAIKGQIAAVDELANVAGRLSIPIDQLAGMQHAANMADIEAAALTTGLQKMMNSIAGARIGEKGPAAALEAIGLNAKELIGMNAAQQFSAIADGIAGIENPAQRVAVAMDIFGKSGAELLNLLNGGAEGLRKGQQEAEKLGLAINAIDAAKISAADDATKRLKASFDGMARSLTVKVAPAMTRWMDSLTEVIGAMESGDDDPFSRKTLSNLRRNRVRQNGGIGDFKGGVFAGGGDFGGGNGFRMSTPAELMKKAGLKAGALGGGLNAAGGGIIGMAFGDTVQWEAIERNMSNTFDTAMHFFESARTPLEKLNDEFQDLQEAMALGLVSQDDFLLNSLRIADERKKIKGTPDPNRLASTAEFGSSSAATILNAAKNGNGISNKHLQAQQQANQHLAKAVTHLGTIAQNSTPVELFP